MTLFEGVAARVLPPARVEDVQRRLLQLDDAPNLRQVVAAIATC